ncbi:hypothetical protein PHMEG_00029435 [Phytophthora megakarya]|uniref:Retrotransposon gag domain-containing protein n=1 Tax=Phytophthora megakarya TaxID=4795 RepID=A0A225V470_9STRA|nr:hypothetical protein PHMEG_00029435 [Phytophthora megakarya]
MLRTISPTEQHGVALGFIMREQHEVAAAKPVSPGETPRKEYLKLRFSNYMSRKGETLLLWLVELDTAVMARRLVDQLAKVAFAMSCLGGRARSWAYGRRLTDPTCFSTYETFKEELKLAFEPPRNEFKSIAEFLDLQQGKQDVHAHAQHARYLVSNVATDPMDDTTKVVIFMKGGPVKTYLFREYPNPLEAAITLAMQEEFSLRQAKLHTNVPRPPRPAVETEGPEPMELSNLRAVVQPGCTKQGAIKPGMMTRARGESGIHKKKRRRNHKTLCKSRSRTETLHGMSTGQTQEPTVAVETLNVLTRTCTGYQYEKMELENPPTDTSALTSLPVMSWKRFAKDMYDGHIERLCILSDRERTTSEAEKLRQLFAGSATESEDTLSAKTKKESFEEQSWDSLKSSPYYEILREHRDVLPDKIPAELPLNKGIQHEIDLVPGTKYCVATAAGASEVTHLLRSVRDFAPSYFEDVYVHSRTVNEKTDVEMHKEHLRELLGLMRKHKLYANLKKCIFGEIPVLGCLVGKNGVRPDPEKVRVINEWPTPSNVKELRQFLGLATYLCKYADNYTGKIHQQSQLLKTEAAWE